MLDTAIQIQPPEALARLQSVMLRYHEVRGGAPVKVLTRAAQNLSIQLYGLFREETPDEGDITFSAWTRGWRIGRDDPAESGPENTGLSSEARERALSKLRGYKSILAHVSTEGGRVRVKPVAYGKRGKLIVGGRSGTRRGRGRFAFVLSGAHEVGRYDLGLLKGQARAAGAKRLNWRALSVVEELNVREAGRRYLAVSWLHRRWQRLTAAARAAGERRLQNVNPRSRVAILGEAILSGSPANNLATLELTSRAAGARDVGQRRGLFGRAVDAVTADMAQFALETELKQVQSQISAALRGAAA